MSMNLKFKIHRQMDRHRQIDRDTDMDILLQRMTETVQCLIEVIQMNISVTGMGGANVYQLAAIQGRIDTHRSCNHCK